MKLQNLNLSSIAQLQKYSEGKIYTHCFPLARTKSSDANDPKVTFSQQWWGFCLFGLVLNMYLYVCLGLSCSLHLGTDFFKKSNYFKVQVMTIISE